jgi:hypothetical protein
MRGRRRYLIIFYELVRSRPSCWREPSGWIGADCSSEEENVWLWPVYFVVVPSSALLDSNIGEKK